MILRYFLQPYFQLLVCALTGTASEIFLKIGASKTANVPSPLPWLGISGLQSGFVWIGILFTILSFLAWMQALRSIPLGVAFTLSNVVHVLVPLSCCCSSARCLTIGGCSGSALSFWDCW